jgi:lysophospholipase L1-like esterase
MDEVCPRRLPDIRNGVCRIPAIPHLVTYDGAIMPHHRLLDFTYSTNSSMFRGRREITKKKQTGIYRILVFGTGVTFGNGVSDDQVYTEVLGRMLNRNNPIRNLKYEVCNLAIPGSCTDIGVSLFTKVIYTIDFDFVVFCYGVNDGLPMFRRSIDDYEKALRRLVWHKKMNNLEMLVLKEPRSSFYPWNFKECEDVFHHVIESDPDIPSISLPEIMDGIEKRRGLRLVRDGEAQKIVRYFFGIPQVLFQTNYTPVADEQSISPEIYEYLDTHYVNQTTYIDGVHLSPKGHEAVAEVIYQWFRKNELPALRRKAS